MNELLIYAASWISLKNMLSERSKSDLSQIKKTTVLEISTNINDVKIKCNGLFLQGIFSQGLPLNVT